jgi:hypothetical protein
MPVKQTTPWTLVARKVEVPTSLSAASTPSGGNSRTADATLPSADGLTGRLAP